MRLARGFALACLLATLFAEAEAEDFRVQNKIFIGEQDEPTSESTTLFHGGVVYDYLSQPEEVTLFDSARGRFVLLDPNRKVQTELKASDVENFANELKQRYASEDEPFLKFLAEPKLEESTHAVSGDLVLSSEWVTYRVSLLAPKNDEALAQYLDFADWYARLNTWTNAGSLPPFARIEVNQVLRTKRELPSSVQVVWSTPKRLGRRETTLRSEHLIQWRLLDSDQQRIRETGARLTEYPRVSPREFFRNENGVKQAKR